MPKSKVTVDEQIEALINDPRHVPLSDMEKRSIREVIQHGERFGFGNMMGWLATAWAIRLRDSGLPEEAAIEAVSGRSPYPLPEIEPVRARKGRK